MKKIKFLTLLFLVLFAFSCIAKSKNSDKVDVRGKIAICKDSKLLLFGAVDGLWQELADCQTDAEGNFSFSVPSGDAKIWAVAETPQNKFSQPYKLRFFAQGGETVEIFVENKWDEYNFGAKPSKQNQYMLEWVAVYDKMFPLFARNTYKDLYPKIDDFIAAADKLAQSVKTGNKKFDEFIKFYIKADAIYGVINFRFMPNTIHPSKEEVHKIYDEFGKGYIFESPLYKQLPISARMMGHLKMQYIVSSEGKADYDSVEQIIIDERIKNNELKAIYFIGNKMNSFRSYEDFESSYTKFKDYIYSDSQKKIIDDYIKQNKRLSKGQPAFNFTFPDVNGKMVSLSDFKGKVVVVDVWATWCGPCRDQIPHLQKLEHEFEGNENVVFIAVSTDKESDKQKWLDMIKDKNMGGIQLLATDGKELMTNYKISGIPRFMVFDKKGNIVSSSAPRPSDPKLKEIIVEELKK